MLAHAWQGVPYTETPPTHQQREQWNLGRRSRFGLHRHEAAARLQMRVIEQLLRTTDRRVGQLGRFELLGQLVDQAQLEALGKTLQQRRTSVHALLVRL